MVRVLGIPRVERDGQTVDLAPRAIGVLARLALEDGWLPRDRLLMDLWGPDVGPERVRSLETLISKIRRAVGDRDLIRFEAGSYRCTSDDIVVDLSQLRDYVQHARQARERSDPALSRIASLAAEELSDRPPSTWLLGSSHWVDHLQTEILDLQSEVRTNLTVDTHRPTGARYVVHEQHHLAYWTFGPSTGVDIVLLGGLSTHLEGMWDEPNWTRWATSLASHHRVIIFDKRGTGLSDPIAEVPTIADFASDTVAVLNATKSENAILVCCGEAGLFGPRVAVQEAGRVRGIVFINAIPKTFRAKDYKPGIPDPVATAFFGGVRRAWGSEAAGLELAAPSRSTDDRFIEWATRYQRLCATPGSLTKLAYFTRDVDARVDVERLTQPALVLHSKSNRYFSPKNATWLAEHIAGSELVLLEGSDHLYWLPEPDRVPTLIGEFLDQLETTQQGSWPDR